MKSHWSWFGTTITKCNGTNNLYCSYPHGKKQIRSYLESMKKVFLGLGVLLLSSTSIGQTPTRSDIGIVAGAVVNHSFGSHWNNERGVRVGVSTSLRPFGESLFHSSLDISLQVTGAKKHQHITGIQTTIPDFGGTGYGFGRVEFSRVSPTLMYNFGFKVHEESKVNPYVTTGLRMDFYYTRFYEELYTKDPEATGANTSTPLTNTSALGFGLGLGTKFVLLPRFHIDFRYELFANWSLNTNTHSRLPDLESFQHVTVGAPIYTLRDRRFQSGGGLSMNLTFYLRDRN